MQQSLATQTTAIWPTWGPILIIIIPQTDNCSRAVYAFNKECGSAYSALRSNISCPACSSLCSPECSMLAKNISCYCSKTSEVSYRYRINCFNNNFFYIGWPNYREHWFIMWVPNRALQLLCHGKQAMLCDILKFKLTLLAGSFIITMDTHLINFNFNLVDILNLKY